MEQLIVTQSPDYEPVTVEMVRAHTVLETDDASAQLQISHWIESAKDQLQDETGRYFCRHTVKYKVSAFPNGKWRLPTAPIKAITSIEYIDEDEAPQTLAGEEYIEKLSDDYSYLFPVDTWPSTDGSELSIVITMEVGEENPNNIKKNVIQAMLLLISHYDQNPSAVVVGTIASDLPIGVDRAISSSKLKFV